MALAALAVVPVATPQAEPAATSFVRQLSTSDKAQFEAWFAAQTVHDFSLDAYWRDVENKRALRRGKKSRAERLTARDYVQTFPPEYQGPALPTDLQKRWSAHQAAGRQPRRSEQIRTVADALINAKKHFGFVPERISEREFKRRYAREALALGLSKDQVLRVYALETGGQGTADMQAGINPITKKGKPISTALGYAQLLAANSVNELAMSGAKFIARLRKMAEQPGIDEQRREALKTKIAAVRRMHVNAKSVPAVWAQHVEYAKTGRGIGIHALNLDGDVGPWLQTIKLHGLKVLAEKAGRSELSGAEIELMNLAGPATGLEMMDPAGLVAPTPNFFARAAYGRNTVVRGRTSAELLEELERRMVQGLKKPGAVEFAEVFDELLAAQETARN
jgi:hypothetical protein